MPRPEGVPRGSRELRPDEPLTEAREAYVETARMVTGKSFDTATVWRRFVNHWIAASRLFGSEGAIDAAWRNWVDAEPRRGKFPVRADTRQPVQNPENYAWMHAEGSSL